MFINEERKQEDTVHVIDLFSSQVQPHNVESSEESSLRNAFNKFVALSPLKANKERSEGTH